MRLRKTFAITKELHAALFKKAKSEKEPFQTMLARALIEQAEKMGDAWVLLKLDNEKKKLRARLSCSERATRKIVAVDFPSPEIFEEFDKMSGTYTKLLKAWLEDNGPQQSFDFEGEA